MRHDRQHSRLRDRIVAIVFGTDPSSGGPGSLRSPAGLQCRQPSTAVRTPLTIKPHISSSTLNSNLVLISLGRSAFDLYGDRTAVLRTRSRLSVPVGGGWMLGYLSRTNCSNFAPSCRRRLRHQNALNLLEAWRRDPLRSRMQLPPLRHGALVCNRPVVSIHALHFPACRNGQINGILSGTDTTCTAGPRDGHRTIHSQHLPACRMPVTLLAVLVAAARSRCQLTQALLQLPMAVGPGPISNASRSRS